MGDEIKNLGGKNLLREREPQKTIRAMVLTKETQ